jgi:hypothetical protein
MLEGRGIDRMSLAARFVSCVLPIGGVRHVGDTNRPLRQHARHTKWPSRLRDVMQPGHVPAAGNSHEML